MARARALVGLGAIAMEMLGQCGDGGGDLR